MDDVYHATDTASSVAIFCTPSTFWFTLVAQSEFAKKPLPIGSGVVELTGTIVGQFSARVLLRYRYASGQLIGDG